MTSAALAVSSHDESVPVAGPPGAGGGGVLSLVRPIAAGRIDVGRVVAHIRHLLGSAEPARVFSQLASIAVPGVADACVIEISERAGHRYRIRQPATLFSGAAQPEPPLTGQRPQHAVTTLAPDAVTVQFASADDGCQSYTGVLTCRWQDDYQPCDADAALLALLVDHATALIDRERLTARIADLQDAAGQDITLPTHQRIAAAVGILMALHHLSAAQAADLLGRAGHHTNKSISGVADIVLRTGAMPEHPHHPTTSELHRVADPPARR